MAKRRRGEFNCPVCFDAFRPPVYQCVNGHLICKSCLPNIEDSSGRCPTCRVQFRERIRSLAADQRAEEEESAEKATRRTATSAAPSIVSKPPPRNDCESPARKVMCSFNSAACPSVRRPTPVARCDRFTTTARCSEPVEVAIHRLTDEASDLMPEMAGVPAKLYQVQALHSTLTCGPLGLFGTFLNLAGDGDTPRSVAELQLAGVRVARPADNVRSRNQAKK